jgi:hypothetical protein
MLRRMTNYKRKPDETWANFIQRTTRQSRKLFHMKGNRSVTTKFLCGQYNMVGKSFARLYAMCHNERTSFDMNIHNFARLVQHPLPAVMPRGKSLCLVASAILWRDREWWEMTAETGSFFDPRNETMHWKHSRPGPHLHWDRPYVECMGKHWKRLAASTAWKERQASFVSKAYEMFSQKPLEHRYAPAPEKIANLGGPPAKKRRIVFREPVLWQPCHGHRLEICGDSKTIIGWALAVYGIKFRPYSDRIAQVHRTLDALHYANGLRPRCDHEPVFKHIFRELNAEADAIAGMGSAQHWMSEQPGPYTNLRLFFDGSFRNGFATSGWVLYGSNCVETDDPDEWTRVAWHSFPVGSASVTAAELEAMSGGVLFLEAYFNGTQAMKEHFSSFRTIGLDQWSVLKLASLV